MTKNKNQVIHGNKNGNNFQDGQMIDTTREQLSMTDQIDSLDFSQFEDFQVCYPFKTAPSFNEHNSTEINYERHELPTSLSKLNAAHQTEK